MIILYHTDRNNCDWLIEWTTLKSAHLEFKCKIYKKWIFWWVIWKDQLWIKILKCSTNIEFRLIKWRMSRNLIKLSNKKFPVSNGSFLVYFYIYYPLIKLIFKNYITQKKYWVPAHFYKNPCFIFCPTSFLLIR